MNMRVNIGQDNGSSTTEFTVTEEKQRISTGLLHFSNIGTVIFTVLFHRRICRGLTDWGEFSILPSDYYVALVNPSLCVKQFQNRWTEFQDMCDTGESCETLSSHFGFYLCWISSSHSGYYEEYLLVYNALWYGAIQLTIRKIISPPSQSRIGCQARTQNKAVSKQSLKMEATNSSISSADF